MKRALLILLLLPLFSAGYGQTGETVGGVPHRDGKIFYERVVADSGKTKDQLYSAAKASIAVLFRNANSVIQSDDRAAGQLICKGSFPFAYTYTIAKLDCTARFTVEITIKDGRYRIRVFDFEFTQGAYDCPMPMIYEAARGNKKWALGFFSEVNAGAQGLLADLQSEVAKRSNADDDKF